MSSVSNSDRGHWFAAALGALSLAGGAFFLFRFPAAPSSLPLPSAKSTVELARPGQADELLRQETEMRDLRPLFLATNRNASLPQPKREPGHTVLDHENPKWSFGDAAPQVSGAFPPIAMLAGKSVEKAEAADTLSIESAEAPLLGFGRRGIEIHAMEGRGGFVEVTAVSSGEKVLVKALPVAARPNALGSKPWSPLEFLAVVDAAGLASPLVLTDGSRVEEVDLHFKTYLTQTFRIGSRLTPGYYRITVAP